MTNRPIVLFYGGTNGSGKSTLREIDTEQIITNEKPTRHRLND